MGVAYFKIFRAAKVCIVIFLVLMPHKIG